MNEWCIDSNDSSFGSLIKNRILLLERAIKFYLTEKRYFFLVAGYFLLVACYFLLVPCYFLVDAHNIFFVSGQSSPQRRNLLISVLVASAKIIGAICHTFLENLVFWYEARFWTKKLSISNWKPKFFDPYTKKSSFSIVKLGFLFKRPEVPCLYSQR